MGAESWVYLATDNLNRWYKIGVSVNPYNRVRYGLYDRVLCPEMNKPTQYRILAQFPGDRDTEQEMHARFVHLRIVPPDRHFTEWYVPDPTILNYFLSLANVVAEPTRISTPKRRRPYKRATIKQPITLTVAPRKRRTAKKPKKPRKTTGNNKRRRSILDPAKVAAFLASRPKRERRKAVEQ